MRSESGSEWEGLRQGKLDTNLVEGARVMRQSPKAAARNGLAFSACSNPRESEHILTMASTKGDPLTGSDLRVSERLLLPRK